MKLLASLHRFHSPRPHGALATLRSPEELRRALEKERARTDRSGHAVFWIIFRLPDARPDPRALQRLGDIIAARVRATDEVGWFDDAGICAILPETDRAGARCFVAGTLHLANAQQLSAKGVIHSYPVVPASPDLPDLPHRPAPRRPLVLVGADRSAKGADAADSEHAQADFAVQNPFLRTMPWWKRVGDIVGAAIGLAVTAPILIAAGVAVKLSSPGPIFFVQRRAGLGGRAFDMYKFRSMCMDAERLKETLGRLNEQDGPAFKIKNDPRITPVGRLLRSTSIDELPQLFNVLKGDMSLVGPRPSTFDEVAKYRIWHHRRFDVTPGITCIWQVRGRARVTFDNWMRMDIQYARKSSIFQDLGLLVETVPAVLLRRGAH